MKRALLSLLLLGSAACNEPFSNEDILFLKSLPEEGELMVGVPGTSTSTSGLRAEQQGPVTAQYYLDARKVSSDLNNIVAFVLNVVSTVRRLPPSAREDDKRVWGPFPDGDLEYLVTIERVRTATVWKGTTTSTRAEVAEHYDYLFAARRPPMEWLPLFAGSSAAPDAEHAGLGYLFLNLEAARALHPGSQDRGLFYVAYDSRNTQVTIEMGIDLVVDPAHPFREIEAGYHYEARADGVKQFYFAQRQNVDGTAPEVLETLIIGARWLPDQQGRADVVIKDGDLGATAYFAAECWDAMFSQRFFYSNVPGAVPVGMITDCAEPLRAAPWER